MLNLSVLSTHAWYELFHPIYLILCLALTYWYFRRVSHFERNDSLDIKKYYFICSIVLFYVVKGTPFAVLAKDYLFSAHMLQLSIIFFVVIPLFILSLPTNYIRKYFWHHRTRLFIHILSKPWLNALLFNGLLTVYFIPSVFNMLKSQLVGMALYQLMLVFLAFMMWWVIISPLPEITFIPYLTRIIYIFFASVLLMPIGIFLLIILRAHYPAFEAVAGNFVPILNAIYDQQLAGGILKLFQLSSYIIALLAIVLRWGKEEEDKEGSVDDQSIRYVRGVVIHLNDRK